MRWWFAVFALLLALDASAFPAFADKRVALLIGNGQYRNVAALANPRNDVQLLKSVLDKAGFDDVKTAFNLGQKELVKALRAFTDEAADADIAVIYYSGHGMEMGGANYLVPVDAALASDLDVPDETVTLDRVLQAIDGAKRLKLVILDACRSNPFLASMTIKEGHRAIEKGLAPVEPSESDTLVAFAAKAGTPALDGEGSNSPFAAALARRLIAPGVDVQFALREVRDDVLSATHRRQEPFTYGSLGGLAIPLSKVPASAEPAPPDPDRGAAALNSAMTAHTIAALDGFLTKYSVGPLADIARSERERLAALMPAPIALTPAPVDAPARDRPKGISKVGFAQTESNNPWRLAQTASMKAEAVKHGWQFVYTDAAGSAAKQVVDVNSMIAQGVDVIFLSPREEKALIPAIMAAKKAGIPLFLIDRSIDARLARAGKDYVAFIGSDFVLEGKQAAEWLVRATNGRATILEIEGSTGSSPANDRKTGFDAVIAQHPDMKIVASQTGNFNRVEGRQTAEALLQAHPEANVIYAHNDEMAIGAIAAVEATGKVPGKDILVVSIDGERDALQAVIDGKLAATAECNPRFGPAAFAAAIAYFKGEKLPPIMTNRDNFYDVRNAAASLALAY